MLLRGPEVVQRFQAGTRHAPFNTLATTAGLVVLFASEILRFGLEGPFVFLVYVLAGSIVALICFGILSSHAQASGARHGISVMFGGPIVALVVVAGGGAVYERQVRPPGR